MSNHGDESQPPFFDSRAPFRKSWRMRWARFKSVFEIRDRFWDVLNYLDANRGVRIRIYVSLAAAVILGCIGAWFYPEWREENAIQMARQWLAAGKLDRAGEAVQVALAAAPQRVETWQLAAEHAQRSGMVRNALVYARHASAMVPDKPDLALAWATAAVAAGDLADADGALARAGKLGAGGTALAERLAGEIARLRGDLSAARAHFETALKIEGPVPIAEVPLGVVLLGAGAAADHARGVAYLEKYKSDPAWGVECLRALLADAFLAKDRAAMSRYASALRVHPAHERSDTFNSLLALAASDEAQFASVLAIEEKDSEGDPGKVADMVGWLSGTGRGDEAIRWTGGMAPEFTGAPPVVLAVADALRVLARWDDLRKWTQRGDWARLDFIRRAFLALASRQLGDAAMQAELWRGLQATARLDGGQAFFLAGVVYSWGWKPEAIELWQIAAENPGVTINAEGALARHYQLQRDADGLYRAFRALYTTRAEDPNVANNYAYLAFVAGQEPARAMRAAQTNYSRNPQNLNYRSTLAFALSRSGRNPEALDLLAPVAAAIVKDPSLSYTYGLVLAAAGRKAEAATVLAKVNPATLTLREEELLKAALEP